MNMNKLSPLGSDLAFILIALVHFTAFLPLIYSLIGTYIFIIITRLIIPQKRENNPHAKTNIKIIDKLQSRKSISGHVARLTILATILGHLFNPIYYSIIILAILVAKERITLRYHTKYDTLTGFAIGFICSILALSLI